MGKLTHASVGNKNDRAQYEAAGAHLIGGVSADSALLSRDDTYIIAAVGASVATKGLADVTCGDDVGTLVNAAYDGGYKAVKLTAGNSATSFPLETSIILPDYGLLKGASKAATKIYLANSANKDILTASTTTHVLQVHVAHMTLDANKANNTAGRCINLAPWQSTFEYLDLCNASDATFLLNTAADASTVDDNNIFACYMHDGDDKGLLHCGGQGVVGWCHFSGFPGENFVASYSNGFKFLHNNLWGSPVTAGGNQLLLYGSYPLVDGNHFNDIDDATCNCVAWHAEVSPGITRSGRFINNDFHNFDVAAVFWVVAGAADRVIQDLVFADNTIVVENGGLASEGLVANGAGTFTNCLASHNTFGTVGTGSFTAKVTVPAGWTVKDNPGYVTENHGVASNVTLDGSGVGAIAHGCATTPTYANVICQSENLSVRVTSIDATNINILVQDLAGAVVTADTHDFYWEAK